MNITLSKCRNCTQLVNYEQKGNKLIIYEYCSKECYGKIQNQQRKRRRIEKCNCYYGCKKKKENGYNYCSYPCSKGHCEHAVLSLGQNIGRPLCATPTCGNAVNSKILENGDRIAYDYCSKRCRDNKN